MLSCFVKNIKQVMQRTLLWTDKNKTKVCLEWQHWKTLSEWNWFPRRGWLLETKLNCLHGPKRRAKHSSYLLLLFSSVSKQHSCTTFLFFLKHITITLMSIHISNIYVFNIDSNDDHQISRILCTFLHSSSVWHLFLWFLF